MSMLRTGRCASERCSGPAQLLAMVFSSSFGARARAGGQVLGREEEVWDRGHLRIGLQHPQGSRHPDPLQVGSLTAPSWQ